ncbi:DUF998 domain-containing protein [Gordonia otitidis]|nr:DUF998 domain-containing protein [Gordonia otitidis]
MALEAELRMGARGGNTRTYRLSNIATALWVSTIQLVAVEEIASSSWPEYSRIKQYVSDLGTAASPNHLMVNTSIALAALCLIAGTLIWVQLGVLDAVMAGGLCVSGMGMLILSWFHLDSSPLIHGLAANMAFAFGPVTTLYIAFYALRDQVPTVLNAIAIGLSIAASCGWVVHATNIEPVRGLTQRVMESFYLLALIAIALILRRSKHSRDSTQN